MGNGHNALIIMKTMAGQWWLVTQQLTTEITVLELFEKQNQKNEKRQKCTFSSEQESTTHTARNTNTAFKNHKHIPPLRCWLVFVDLFQREQSDSLVKFRFFDRLPEREVVGAGLDRSGPPRATHERDLDGDVERETDVFTVLINGIVTFALVDVQLGAMQRCR
jgi:predicted alpha/beta-fold hydrolase